MATPAMISAMPGHVQKPAAFLTKLPQIVECHRITGDDCHVAVAHVAAVPAMEKLIDRIVPYGSNNTAVIQSLPVRRRVPDIKMR
jgi:Lrp/AsnC family transcriptional regulator, leucine-responsive regulatory protein